MHVNIFKGLDTQFCMQRFRFLQEERTYEHIYIVYKHVQTVRACMNYAHIEVRLLYASM